ncbi:carboxymuconolactone decarboxylase [Pseudonocardia sulfidoxydans NBRC 16205]|uniref:Carboxymuconolactone decarboxylase n=1 Tax=Pseudonocardia sulfidoxydans NBRC 16205 TaxID=1223511 RepID=A0A511DMQ3_9PSEU|nr:carboxymuconolactone decarboxylase family protein [Pseudonocardia sulfidoxydans]GEL26096.1 carboxymuconolactone decarboxylase [Pseudonocardia sulfidoxydans NBRC 16205]
MSRLTGLRPADMDDEQRDLYDRIVGSRRGPGTGNAAPITDDGGALRGPFDAMLRAPGIGDALQNLGAGIRFRGGLSGREREMAILVVAAHWRSAFEQRAHEAAGRAAGLADGELAALRDGNGPALDDPREAVLLATARSLAVDGDLDDTAYAAAVDALGEPGLFELTTLVGYYATLALQMRVFRVG